MMETSSKFLDGETLNSLVIKIKEILNVVSCVDDDSKLPIFSDSLSEIATFTHIASNENELSELNDKLATQICSSVFNFKTKPYDALLSLDGIGNEISNWGVLEFFQKMHELLQNSDCAYADISGIIACASLMKRIMQEIFKEKRSDMEPLKILSLFCAMCGLDIPLSITASSCCNKMFEDSRKNSSINIVALNYILEGSSTCSQYFNLTTAPEGYLIPRSWLEGLMCFLLDVDYSKNKNFWLKCFRSILRMSLSVVENNLTLLIKSCLVNVTVNDVDSKEEFCGLFIDLISLFSRLHQLPKFFTKLLLVLTESVKENSFGQWVSKGQIFPIIFKTFALHCLELPFGQTLALWKIFLEIHSPLMSSVQIYPKGKGAMLILAKLFSTFLLHSKLFDSTVPSVMYETFGDMIMNTTKELKKNISILFEKDEETSALQQSFLLLCFALGEVKLIYSDCHEDHSNDELVFKLPQNSYDCSLLLKFFNEEHTNVLEAFLKGEDLILSFLVFQLLIQKIKGLLHKNELSEDEQVHLQNSISCILQHAKQSILCSGIWNMDLNTLNFDNYGSAVWWILLKYLPLFLNSVDRKNLFMICSCFRDIVLQENSNSPTSSELDLKSIVLSTVQSVHYQESKNFQIAFIAAIWKFDSTLLQKKRTYDEMESEENFFKILTQLSVFRSKWAKYAESTPKSNQDDTLNSLWNNMNDTCILFNQVLQSKSIVRPKLKAEVYNILELVDCLPLEYLLPGNQVRCIIGLSVLLFLTPESLDTKKAFVVSEKISKLLISIFEGVRSVWFFDFVDSFSYLKEIVTTLDRLMMMKENDENLKWPKLLLHSVIRLITRKKETLAAAEVYFSELNTEENISEISSLALLLALEQLVQAFKKTHLQSEYKETCEKMASLLCSCSVKLLKKTEEKYSNNAYCTLIQCYSEVIKILNSPSCNFDQKKKEKYLKQLPKIIKVAKQSICDTKNDNDAYFKFFASICNHNQDISNFVPADFPTIIWEIVYFLLQQQCLVANSTIQKENVITHPMCLKENERELLQSLFTLMPKEDINNILENLFKQMENVDLSIWNVFSLQMSLNIITQIIESDSKKPESSLSATILVNILSQLCRIVLNRANDDDFYVGMVKIPILEFYDFILKQKKSRIPKQNLLYCLQVCKVVKFKETSNNLQLFLKNFDAVWNIIYNLLIHHAEIVLSSTHSFVQIIIILLRSFIVTGSKDLVSAQDKEVQLQIIQYAQNIDRLFTVMARHKTSFAKLVPNLIAEYVNCVQNVTLDLKIKEHLISGINRLFSFCSEDSLEAIRVNINHSCRDIFTNIEKNYKQFKYCGDV